MLRVRPVSSPTPVPITPRTREVKWLLVVSVFPGDPTRLYVEKPPTMKFYCSRFTVEDPMEESGHYGY